jgi:hypothetical protein
LIKHKEQWLPISAALNAIRERQQPVTPNPRFTFGRWVD